MIKKTLFISMSVLLAFNYIVESRAQSLRVHSDSKLSQNKPAVQTTTNISPANPAQETTNKVEPQTLIPDTKQSKEEAKEVTEPVVVTDQQNSKIVLENMRATENNPLRKAARGAVNATLGWVEIPRQIVKANNEKKGIGSIMWSPVKGVSNFVTRTVVGIYEITTFLIPPYKPVVDPEFIFPDEKE